MKLEVKASPNNRRVRLLVSELDERMEAILHWVPYYVAEATLDEISGTAPRDIAGYPRMLSLRRVQIPQIDEAIGILAPGYKASQRLKRADAATTLLFITPRRVVVGTERTADPKAAILGRHSPWTMTTLPFEPDRRIASITSRRVSEREVTKVEAMRRKDLPAITKQLADLGAPVRKNKLLLSRRVSRDIGFEVLRREFGIGARHHAHWRPALRRARGQYLNAALKKVIRWLAIPSERRWMKPAPALPKETAGAAKRIRRFQDAVAGGR